MKRKWGSFFLGMAVMALVIILSGKVLASGTMTNLRVLVGGIKIVVDGDEIHPTDVNGNTVEPMIYNGTTYLPVRAVASSLGKAVYWDGSNYTVYLGDMDGTLEYPTVAFADMTNIGSSYSISSNMTDNYGNRYESAVQTCYGNSYEFLLNMQYSHFKGTVYISNGERSDGCSYFTVKADGKTLYTSPEMTKVSAPIAFDVNVTGYNDITISFFGTAFTPTLMIGDAGFYQ